MRPRSLILKGGLGVHDIKRQKGNFHKLLIFSILLILFMPCMMVYRVPHIWAEDEKTMYPDRAGQEALAIWAERERERLIADAYRRYWDYWLSNPGSYYYYPPPPPPPYWMQPPYPTYPRFPPAPPPRTPPRYPPHPHF